MVARKNNYPDKKEQDTGCHQCEAPLYGWWVTTLILFTWDSNTHTINTLIYYTNSKVHIYMGLSKKSLWTTTTTVYNPAKTLVRAYTHMHSYTHTAPGPAVFYVAGIYVTLLTIFRGA